MDSDRRAALDGVIELDKMFNEVLLPFQQMKDGRRYNKSWARRGLLGYMHGCLFRQTDRLEPGWADIQAVWNLPQPFAKGIMYGAVLSFMDTLYDVGMYALMGLRLLATYWPSEFNIFLEAKRDELDASKLDGHS